MNGELSQPDRIVTERNLRRIMVAVAAVPAIAILLAERFVFGDLGGFPLDDAWIHLHFAERLAAGAGLSYQGSELVAGSTAPLWTALLALIALLPVPLAAATKLVALGAHIGALALVFRIGRRLDLSPARAAVATLLVGLADGLVFSVPSGMEVNLFVLLELAGLLRHLDERSRRGSSGPAAPPVSLLLFALAALARPEGLLLLALAMVDRFRVAGASGLVLRRPSRSALGTLLRGLAVAALVIAPVAWVYWHISGSALPTTLMAKSSGPPLWIPQPRHLGVVLEILFASQPLLTLLAAGGAIELARRLGSERDSGLLLPLWTAGLPVASAMLSSGREFLAGNFGRYFFPLLPCVVLLGMVALEPLAFARWRSLGLGRVRLPLAALGLILLFSVPLLRTARAVTLALTARGNVEASDLAAAYWLAGHADPTAKIATVDIGVLGHTLANPLLDLGGIVSPGRRSFLEAKRREQGLDWQRSLALWIEHERPEYIVVFPAWFPLLERAPERYPALARFRIRDNVAMAGDELVVYATPWTRKAPRP